MREMGIKRDPFRQSINVSLYILHVIAQIRVLTTVPRPQPQLGSVTGDNDKAMNLVGRPIYSSYLHVHVRKSEMTVELASDTSGTNNGEAKP